MVVLEGVATAAWLVWRALLVKTITWKTFICYIVCVLICVAIYYIDTDRYVYVVEDDE